ncbi:MAG: transcription factor [Thermoprotei archaeon]
MPKKSSKQEESKLALDNATKYYVNILLNIVEKMYGSTARKVLEHIVRSGGSAPEETIGRDAGVRSNEARKILQKLSNEAILTCRGKRVSDKVLHFWTINWDQVEGMLINRLKKTREKLETLLRFEEENIVYECPACGRRFSLDKAIELDYICPYDGEMLVESNKEEIVKILRKTIEEIDKELNKLGASK